MEMQITKEREMDLVIEGNGNTIEQAFSAALSNIRNQVANTPLRIEPLAVTVLEAIETQYTERFLFLFFKRTRSKFKLRLQVRVRVVTVDLEQISWQVETESFAFRSLQKVGGKR